MPLLLFCFNITLPHPASAVDPPEAEDKFIKETENAPINYRLKTVVIDAGHGGHDPGCLGGNSREKHLALGIALHLAEQMRSKYPSLKIIMTRDKDVFIPLYKRAAIANRNNADLFISIHCNYMPGSSATRGSETYVMGLHKAEHNLQVAKRENAAILLEDNYEKNYDYDPESPEGHIMLSMFQNAYLEQSVLFAEMVEAHLHDAGRRSRGVKQAGFVVLKETTMPSVLVEAGFLSNRREEAYLMTRQGQQQVASAMLDAFTDYKTTIESRAYQQVRQSGKPVANLPTGEPVPATLKKEVQQDTQLREPKERYDSETIQTNAHPRRVYTNVWAPEQRGTTGSEQAEDQTRRSPVPQSNNTAPSATHAASAAASKLQFFVQLAASSRPQDTQAVKWQNLPYQIEVVQERKLYKYRARDFDSIDAAMGAKADLRSRGWPDAFLVILRNGERISIDEARRELGLPPR